MLLGAIQAGKNRQISLENWSEASVRFTAKSTLMLGLSQPFRAVSHVVGEGSYRATLVIPHGQLHLQAESGGRPQPAAYALISTLSLLTGHFQAKPILN